MAIEFKILDSDRHYYDYNFSQLNKLKDIKQIDMWKNDIKIIQVVVVSDKDIDLDLQIIADKNFEYKIYCVEKNLAYSGYVDQEIPLYTLENREKASDLLANHNSMKLKAGKTNSFYIELATNKNISKDKNCISFKIGEVEKNIYLNVIDKYVDFRKQNFDLELWQYPYSISDHYKLKPFSDEHIKVLKDHMMTYRDLGGHAIVATIVEDAWNGQTYSKNDIHYPSMVKWILEDDVITYDYSDFDKWIKLNHDIGLGIDKIVVYGMAPWHGSFTIWKDGKLIKEKFDVKSKKYRDMWLHFLEDFYKHIEKLDIEDSIYIGIDEQGFCPEIFEVLDHAYNIYGKKLKVSAAIDNYQENAIYADKIAYVSVAQSEYEKNKIGFFDFYKVRNSQKKMTSLYSCVGHRPGNYVLSQPGETYFTLIYSSICSGFLRWAYDAWVKDPRKDATHSSFEPGDCFLVYPNKETLKTDISIRYLKIKEAMYDINKLLMLYDRDQIFEIMKNLETTVNKDRPYLDDSRIEILTKDLRRIRASIYK